MFSTHNEHEFGLIEDFANLISGEISDIERRSNASVGYEYVL
jgi:hypothetical protein